MWENDIGMKLFCDTAKSCGSLEKDFPSITTLYTEAEKLLCCGISCYLMGQLTGSL